MLLLFFFKFPSLGLIKSMYLYHLIYISQGWCLKVHVIESELSITVVTHSSDPPFCNQAV